MYQEKKFDSVMRGNMWMPHLAIATVPMQEWREIFPPERGFCKGTIFMELEKQWCPKEANCHE